MKYDDKDMPDWERAYWANREKQIAATPQRTNTVPQQPPATREVDAVGLLQQRMFQQQMVAQQTASSAQAVMLREGAPYYKLIPNPDGFGTVVPLIRHMGTLTQVAGREFALLGETRGYLVDNSPVIDLSKISENPDKFLKLIHVRAPFVGDILVNKETVIFGVANTGRGILRG